LGEDGPDREDVHNLRADSSDLIGEMAGRYFGDCDEENDDHCMSPFEESAAISTSKNRHVFKPPTDIRGDIARTLFYMAFRYDGEEEETENLMFRSSSLDWSFYCYFWIV